MKYLQKILIAIIISAPLSVSILIIGELTINWILQVEREYTDTLPTLISMPIFFGIVYIVYGLPTTLIADGLVMLRPLSKFKFLTQFVIYTLTGLVLAFILSKGPLGIMKLVTVLFPAYLYLCVLTLVRKKDRK